MMIMVNQKNIYAGGIQNDKDAAVFYDHMAILSQGLGAKTNFDYNCHQIKKILRIYEVEGNKDHSSASEEITIKDIKNLNTINMNNNSSSH